MTTTIIIPSNPADLKVIKDHVTEACNSLLRIDSENAQIKAIIDDLDDLFPDIGTKYIKRLIKDHHKMSFNEKSAENEDYEYLYLSLFPVA